MLVSLFSGIAMGAGVFSARSFGSKDYQTMEQAIHTNLAFGLVSGLLLTVLAVTFTPTILGWMGTPKDVLPQSIEYFRYFFCGVTFTVMYNVFVGILHAVGDSRHPLYYLIVSSVVNVVLDLVLVGGLGYGVGAAALATTISQGISAVLCAIRLVRYETPYQLKIREIRFHKRSMLDIVRYGLPSGIQNSVIALANVVVQTNINSFGKEAMAGCGAYAKVEGFAFLPVTCFTQALSTFVGQNLGARKYERVKKGVAFGLICPMLAAEAIGMLLWLLAPQIIGIFNGEPVVIDYGVRHLRTIAPFYCLLALSHCFAGIMRGAGKATVPMVTMLLCWCALRVSYITVAVKMVNELETVSRAYPITWTCSSIILLIYFLKADWMHNFERIEGKRKNRELV
jgi:putative MATE family efflux protein